MLRLERRIAKDGLASVDSNLHSAPGTTRRRPVEVRSTTHEPRIPEEGQVVAAHPVLDGRGPRLARKRTAARRPGLCRMPPLSASAAIVSACPCCVRWKRPRALETLDAVAQQLERGQIGATEATDALPAEELTVREGRRIKAALPMARLATIKAITGFAVSFQPSLDRGRVMALAALGVEAVRAGRSACFSPLADRLDSLAKADREGRLRERIRHSCRAQPLVVDESGCLAVGSAAANLVFPLAMPAANAAP